jgi:hypothetical protein
MREHGWHSPDASSVAAPMRNRRPLSATRLMPRTTMLRRSASGATASTPRWLAIAAQALGRDERHLARAAGVAVAVAGDALAGDQLGRVEDAHRGAAPGRAPIHSTVPGRTGAAISCASEEEAANGIANGQPARRSARTAAGVSFAGLARPRRATTETPCPPIRRHPKPSSA